MNDLIGVAGATGFVGRHLTEHLVQSHRQVRALVRSPAAYRGPAMEVREFDVTRPETLLPGLEGVAVAYYLIHSMGKSGKNFADVDRQAAQAFTQAASRAGVRRIIYLGGLLPPQQEVRSKHLRSRFEVERIFIEGPVQAAALRAGAIIGSGSPSWDLIRLLVKRLPLMITPRWVFSKSRPISIDDCVQYLSGCADIPLDDGGRAFDIGGPNQLSYKQLLKLAGKEIRGFAPFVIGAKVPLPRLSSLWVVLVTGKPWSLVHPLIQSLQTDLACNDKEIRRLIPFELTPIGEAIKAANRA